MNAKVRTRFAPSPTGYMHVGNLRTALYEYLIAKKNGGDFVLRIEDTDRERYVEGATDVIYNTLRQTGLIWDEGPDKDGGVGPYVQSERRDIYIKYAHKLCKMGKAYYCFCTKEELDAKKEKCEQEGTVFRYDGTCAAIPYEQAKARVDAGEEYVIRQKMPKEGVTSFTDAVFGEISIENSELEDQILLKSDGMPTYNFANVIDDHLMGITHVVRGSEYLTSTPKYNLLYEAFGWEPPVYVHCSPVMKDAQNKLSKRNGDASYQDLIAKGYLSEAVMNYIALLGWSPKGEQEKFSLAELIEAFDISGISKSPAIFDPEKLRWLNAEYIRCMSLEDFHAAALPYIKQAVS
ncbi:MAG: glutamate--tRNA ligase, partial [Clostridia bacterium]|nr:glutamate--tRNA ligase [Clostridia bacterium]